MEEFIQSASQHTETIHFNKEPLSLSLPHPLGVVKSSNNPFFLPPLYTSLQISHKALKTLKFKKNKNSLLGDFIEQEEGWRYLDVLNLILYISS